MKQQLVLAIAIAPAPALAAPALNHVYVVLDQATFDAIRASPLVARTLGRADDGLPDYASPPPRTDRIFLRGRRTYLELFAPTNRFKEPVGKVGIALGEDRPAPFEKLAKRWRGWCGADFQRDDIAWTRQSPSIPWYTSVQCNQTATGERLALWAMAYRPEFAHWQRATGTGRAAILAVRAATGQGLFDVASVTLDLPSPLLRRTVAQLTRAGMVARNKGNRVHLQGAGWALSLLEVRGHARLSRIAFAVEVGQVAKARLGTARWSVRARTGSLSL